MVVFNQGVNMTEQALEASDRQVGGDHYKATYQHWHAMEAEFGYGWFAGCATKYIARFGRKEQDTVGLEKAIHYMERAIEIETVSPGWCICNRNHTGAEAALLLTQSLGIKNEHARQAIIHAMTATCASDMQTVIEQTKLLIEDANHGEHGKVPENLGITFTPAPINGYRTLRADEVNLINLLKKGGSTFVGLLHKVFDLYEAEDAAADREAKLLQEDFNTQVQAIIAELPALEGESEDATYERRMERIRPLEQEVRTKLEMLEAAHAKRLESARWNAMAKQRVQEAVMFAVRAVARPEGDV
jgi:hypothetical protein